MDIECRVIWPDKSVHWIWWKGCFYSDPNGQPIRAAGMVGEMSARKSTGAERQRIESLLWRNANFDSLTELPNRRLFWDRLEQEVRRAQRTGKPVCLFYLDLDRFKEINDLFGHEIGDQLLIEVAKRINACVRSSDTIARLSADEFTIILPQLEALSDGERIAQKILAALTLAFYFDELRIEVSASIGIAIYPTDSSGVQQLVNNADHAMHLAKTLGRNQFCYFTPSMQIRAQQRLHMGVDLRSALKPDQLSVFFQPIICIASGRIVKAEALLRWRHPVQGLIEPSIFIPLAEELGLIGDIGEWVFREAATWAAEFARYGQPNFQISVNMSAHQFARQVGEFSWPKQLQAMGLPCNLISVEITESALLQDSRMVIDTLRAYREAGMEIALDDFGTGYSSMSYLLKFGIDYLKIDQSFVRNLAQKNSRTIAETIIVMGHKLGLKVIAEGVETTDQLSILKLAGCDYVQGYLFSPALPPEEFGHMLIADAEKSSDDAL